MSSKDIITTTDIVSIIVQNLISLIRQQTQQSIPPQQRIIPPSSQWTLLREGLSKIFLDDNSISLTWAAFCHAPCITADILLCIEKCARLPIRTCLLLGLSLFLGLTSTTAAAAAATAHAPGSAHEALKYFRMKLDVIAAAKKPVPLFANAPFTQFLRSFVEAKGPALQLPLVTHLFVTVPAPQSQAKKPQYVPPRFMDMMHPATLLYALGPKADLKTQIFTARKTLNEEDVAQIIEILVKIETYEQNKIIPFNKNIKSVWNIKGIADEIQALQREGGLDWNKVLGMLDRPSLFVADHHGALAISELYKHFNGGQSLPSAFLFGAWANRGAQLSFLRAAIIAQEPALFEGTTSITPTSQSSSSSLSSSSKSQSLWCYKPLVNALLRIFEDPECASAIQILFEIPYKNMPNDLFTALAECKEGPRLRLFLEKMLLFPHGMDVKDPAIIAADFEAHWERSSSAVISVLCDMYALDRDTVPAILRAATSNSRLRTTAFPALLEGAPPAFAVDLAVHAAAEKLIDIERWLTQKVRSAPILAACVTYIREHAAKKDVDAPYAVILRCIRSAATANPAEVARLAEDPAVVEVMRMQRKKELERQVTDTFARVRKGSVSVASFVGALAATRKRIHSGAATAEEEAQYHYTVKCVLDEYAFLDQYQPQDLRMSAIILGEIIAREAVHDADLIRAMQNVLDALKAAPLSSPSSPLAAAATTTNNRFQYGAMALARFLPALRKYPSYVAKVLGTPGLEDADPALYAQIAAISASSSSTTSSSSSRTNAAITAVTAVDDSVIPAKVRGILNNISQQNIERMIGEFRRGICAGTATPDPKMTRAVAQNILRRIATEKTHHETYMQLLDRVGLPDLRRAVMAAVYAEIRRNLTVCGVSGTTSATEKELEQSGKHLATLGTWVGLQTLGRDEPIRRADLDLRALLKQTEYAPALRYALPFVSNVLECCKTSTVFRPPNKWLCGVLRALADIYVTQGHSQKTLHEVKRVFEALGIPDLVAYATPTQRMASGDESAGEATLGFIRDLLYARVRVGCTLDALATKRRDRCPWAAMVAKVARPLLVRKTVAAVARVVEMVCRGEVPRAVADAVQAAECMVLKDLAHDPSEERLVTSAVLTAKSLAGGMALVSCSHTLAKLMIERLVSVLAELLDVDAAAAASDAELADVAKLLVYENFDAACIAVSRRAEELATSAILERIAGERSERREYCRYKQTAPFTSTSWLNRCAAAAATPLPPRTKRFLDAEEAANEEGKGSGISQGQYEVYKDFGRLPILIPRLPLDRTAAAMSDVGSLEELRAAAVRQVNALVTSSQQISRGLDMLSYEEVCTQYLLCLKKIETVCAQRMATDGSKSASEIIESLKKDDPVLVAAEDLEYALDYALRLQPGQESPERSKLMWPLFRYLIDVTTPELTREVIFFALRRRPKVFKNAISDCFVMLPQEKKFFPGLIPALLAARLIDQNRVDNAIFTAVHNTPSDQMAMYAAGTLNTLVLTCKYPPTDFERSITELASSPNLNANGRKIVEAAQRLLVQQRQKTQNHAAQVQQRQQFRYSPQQQQQPQQRHYQQQYQQQTPQPSQSPQPMKAGQVAQSTQSGNGINGSSNNVTNSTSETASGNDKIDVELHTAFYSWCDAVESKDEARMRETFLRMERELEGSEKALLKCSFEVALRDVQLTSPDAPWRYLHLDAYGSLVVYMSQSTARASKSMSLFCFALELLLEKLKSLKSAECVQAPEPLVHLICFLAGHADVFPVNTQLPMEQDAAAEPLSFFTNLLLCIHPLNEPGLAFVWLETFSNKVFLRRVLAMQQNWGSVQRQLVMLMRFLYTMRDKICGGDDNNSNSNSNNSEESDSNGSDFTSTSLHLLIEGAAQLLAIIREAYPSFLAAYHFSLCTAIPPALANLRNIILSASPTPVPPLFTHVHVEQLPGAADPPVLLDDYTKVFGECAQPRDVDACIAAPDTASYAWVHSVFLPGVRNANLQNASFNALVLYVGNAIVKTPGLRNNAFRFLRRLLALLQPQHSYLFLGAIANQLRYPNAHTIFFSKVMTSLFLSPLSSGGDSPATAPEFVKEQILRVLYERIQRTQVQPWGLIVTWAEILLNPKYKPFECKALVENPPIKDILLLQRGKFIELYNTSIQQGTNSHKAN